MADVSVRPARPEDAERVARVQLSTWRTAYARLLPPEALDVPEEQAAALWLGAVEGPPTPEHRLLVAMEGPELVGFAASGPAGDDGLDPGTTVELLTLLVEPRWGRRGHGSRLVAASVEHWRGAGFGTAVVWAWEGDPATRGFLTGSGWEPDGAARGLDTGQGVQRQLRFHTDLREGLMHDGFPEEALVFYEGLEADNTKAYWTDHKHVYDRAVKAPLDALLADLAPEFGPAKVFRPYRDVRFSKDKTPYKTHAAAVVEGDGSLYVQLGADGLFVGGGYWHTESDQVQRLRAAVDDDLSGRQLQALLDGLAGWEVMGERLKRMPKPYAPDHPRADLLLHKGLAAGLRLEPDEWLHTAECAERVAAAWRQVQPLNAWLAQHVGPTRQERPARR